MHNCFAQEGSEFLILNQTLDQISGVRAPASREVIYQSDRLSVVHAERGGECVFVTFNEMGLHAKGTLFWGAELLDSMNISAIGFVSSRPNWYPPADMMPAIDEALKRIRGRRVITYGFSQGAYGALKYGRLLNADLALAFSPQWSINPADVDAFDKRFTAFYDPLLKNGERITAEDLGKTSFVFVDDGHLGDRESARRLALLGHLTLVPMPFTSHDTVRLVSEARIGRSLIQLCLDGSANLAELRHLLRKGRNRSTTYTRYKLHKLLTSVHRHRNFYDAAVATMPDGAEKKVAVVHLHLALGCADEAERTFSSVTDDQVLKLDFISFWRIFRSHNFLYGEARLAPLFRRRYPNHVFARLHGVSSMIACQQFDIALEELAILEHFPGVATHKNFFVQFYRQLDRADLAAGFLEALAVEDDRIRPDRIKLGFELVSMFKARGLRADMFRELTSLNVLCKDDPSFSLKLVEGLTSIGEYGLAKEIIETRLVSDEDRREGEGYLILFLTKADMTGARERLQQLFLRQEGSADFWLRISYTARGLLGVEGAVRACQNALRCDNGVNFNVRYRLATLLEESGRRRHAQQELRQCALLPQVDLHSPQRFIDLAVKLGDPKTGATFARRWATQKPNDPQALVECGLTQVRIGQLLEAEETLRSILTKIEAGMKLDVSQFDAMTELAEHLSDELLVLVWKAARAAFPDESRFRAGGDVESFLSKFRLSKQNVDRTPATRDQWFRRLIPMLSRGSRLERRSGSSVQL